MNNLDDYINSKNPLTRETALFLLDYAEEDNRVDYKKTIDIASDKEWLSLTKDISAFANTQGGYLIFGVEDQKKSITGLTKDIENILKDANNLQSKINSYLEPEISTIRTKAFRIDRKTVVVIYIPQSFNVTHLIKKEGVIYKQSKNPRTILNKGTFYVRRSASNHLGDSRDLDDVVERRIDQFRDALIDKVARIVKTPADSNLFILSKDPEDTTGERFIIEDSPDSIPVQGMSFTVSPQGYEEEVAAWSVLSSGRSNIKPPPEIVWAWYSQRKSIELRATHKLSLFQFSLWTLAPAFYWIKGLENTAIREALLNAIRVRPIGTETKQFLIVASFLGKATYKAALRALGDYVNKIPERMQNFPTTTPRIAFGTIKPKAKQPIANLKKEKFSELNEIANEAFEKQRPPGSMKKWKAQEIDCFLYAQDNNYK